MHRADAATSEAAPEKDTETPRGALDFIVAHQGPGIFHLQDFHEPLRESAATRRRLRDVYQSCLDQNKFTVISSPVRFIPEEVERSVMYLELRQPDRVELEEFLRRTIPTAGEPVVLQFANALQGLTLDEAGYALRRAVSFSLASGQPLGERSLCLPSSKRRSSWSIAAASSSLFPKPPI